MANINVCKTLVFLTIYVSAQLSFKRCQLAYLYKTRQNLVDNIDRLYAQHNAVRDDLLSGLNDQYRQSRVLDARLALKSEHCSTKRRKLRMIQAECNRVRQSLEKLRNSQKL